MSRRERFLDGCHRYGWLITIAVNLAMFAFFMGGMRADISNLKTALSDGLTVTSNRIAVVEQHLYELSKR